MLKTFTNLTVLESFVGKEESKKYFSIIILLYIIRINKFHRIATSILDFLIENGLFNYIRDTMLAATKKIEEKVSVLLLSLQRFNPDLSNILGT